MRVSADAAGSGSSLEQRVAVLEAALLHPPVIAEFPAMSAEDAARFKEEYEAAARDFGHQPLRIFPSSLTVLNPETVRALLRESVTVVKPGEVLFFTVSDPNITPGQLRAIQEMIDWWLERNAPGVRVLALMSGEFAAAEPGPA
jgi:hypothetical protein